MPCSHSVFAVIFNINVIDFGYEDIMNYFNHLKKEKNNQNYETKLTPYAKHFVQKVYQSFKYQIWRRMEYILQNSSCHGGNWVMKLSNSKIKSPF